MQTQLSYLKFNALLGVYRNASLVNSKGELISSKDASPLKTTTSRLVLFQIAKKYLLPKPGDVVICNDPLNGGTALHRLYFIGCLRPNLFIIWDDEFLTLDIKIPLTPVIEKHRKNEMIWGALLAAQQYPDHFEAFLNKNMQSFFDLEKHKAFLDEAASEIFQKNWFKITDSVFKEHFNHKALGSSQLNCSYKDFNYKLELKIEEKQNNQQQIQVDFSSLNRSAAATAFSAASHVVESGLLIEISKHYNVERFLSQPILDRIRLVLPPNSALTKAHPTGEYNFEIQKMTRQFIRHTLSLLSAQEKKGAKKFDLYSTYLIQYKSGPHFGQAYLSNSRVEFENLDLFNIKSFYNLDGQLKGDITTPSEEIQIRVMGVSANEDKTVRWIKVNESLYSGSQEFKTSISKNDSLKFHWKLQSGKNNTN